MQFLLIWFIYDLDDSHVPVSDEQEVIKTLQSLSISQKQDQLNKQVLLANSNAPDIEEYGHGKGTEFKLILTSKKQTVNTLQIFQVVLCFAYVCRALQVDLFFSNNNLGLTFNTKYLCDLAILQQQKKTAKALNIFARTFVMLSLLPYFQTWFCSCLVYTILLTIWALQSGGVEFFQLLLTSVD